MTDRPWGAWRGQAGPPSAPSIGRLGHPGPHDVPTLQLPFFRRSAEAWGKHSSQMHRCSSGRQRTSGRKRVSERKQHRTPSAVANLFDKKELFERSAAGALRVPSHITERNQPPAPRPTAALYLALIFSLQIRRLRTNNYSDYACKRNASRLHPALPATCRDRVAGVLLICNQAAKFLERQCLRASLNDATPWQQNDAVIAHQEPDIRIASAHWMFDDWLQPRSWTAFVSAFGSIIVTL